MGDYLVKALAQNSHFRIYAVNASQLVATAQKSHDTWSASTAALGRSLIGTLLLSTSLMKNDEILTARILGDGPVGLIVADGNANGQVKGYIQNPHISVPLNTKGKIDVQKAVGHNGLLTVTRDNKLGQPFTGKVPLISGEIAEDYAYYLATSEQIPAAVGLSVFVESDNQVSHAGGFMVQAMPDATDSEIEQVIQTINSLPPIHEMLQSGDTPEELVQRIFATADTKFLTKMPVTFQCDCSKERFGKSLAALSAGELQDMIDQQGGAETVCKFCGQKYQFSKNELEQMIVSNN
ncbi:Hsp33 family molecular chaperone HslO [Bombilactobacillus thymidiniphilus]|uniref:33 kDa chaperonin n=1 Tax=Bombilactobacillus thymidiniphilus TaxID=2923363 RepID=A0ABY4PE18_9LACO|nr:Hsp33 family molecular chaperone HslO [Bombilactobacillus thymidiniphilus]UQS84019.1 Hsp33 family molecular chaperone HslO [Bombilactobacillus thymidiniphilus]